MTEAPATSGRARTDVRVALSLRALPARVGWFYARAWMRARRERDRFSLSSAVRPAQLARLLALASGRRRVVELGTGTAWTAVALAVPDAARRVVSLDPVERPQRTRYLQLVGLDVRARVELRTEPDTAGPRPGDAPVEFLFVDALHEREATMAAFRAWRAALAPGAVVVFHDFDHPAYPGVREAVDELGLVGEAEAGLFVWRAPAQASARTGQSPLSNLNEMARRTR